MTYRITTIRPPLHCKRGLCVVLIVPQNVLRMVGTKREDWEEARDRHVRRVADSCGCAEDEVICNYAVVEY